MRHQQLTEDGIALLKNLLDQNTELTRQVSEQTQRVHEILASYPPPGNS